MGAELAAAEKSFLAGWSAQQARHALAAPGGNARPRDACVAVPGFNMLLSDAASSAFH